MIVLCCVVGRERGSGSVDLCFENGEWGMGKGKKKKTMRRREMGNGKRGEGRKEENQIRKSTFSIFFFFFAFLVFYYWNRKKWMEKGRVFIFTIFDRCYPQTETEEKKRKK